MRQCRTAVRWSRRIWEPVMADTAVLHKELLRVGDLHAWYGESHILHGMNFSVGEGEIVTLLGRNGAGRTTTLRAIMGLVGSRTGSVMIEAIEAVRFAPHDIARMGIGYCPAEPGSLAALTTERNVLLSRRLE